LFLESQLSKEGARSIRVTRANGDVLAGVGDDAFADEWVASATIGAGDVRVESSGGRLGDEVARGVKRIMTK